MDVNLNPCKSAEFVTPAQRPANSCFDCSKIESVLGKPIENWKIILERFLEKDLAETPCA